MFSIQPARNFYDNYSYQLGHLLLPTIVPAASTLSKHEQDRLAMPPPPTPQVSVAQSGEGARMIDSTNKDSFATPLAGTIGSGR